LGWAQLAVTTRPPPRAGLLESRPANAKALEEQTAGGNCAAFRKRLKDPAGKSVTVVLQEEERTNTFAFTVKQRRAW
jgi:hypothetical protein